MNLKLLAAFGDLIPEAQLKDGDTIEQLSFSGCDKYVASGDHAGRISVYRIKPTGKTRSPLSFSLATTIQAFAPKFNGARDEQTDPKVTCLQWFPRVDMNPIFVAANHCEIKLFKLTVSATNMWNKPTDASLLPTLSKSVESYNVKKVQLFKDPEVVDIHKILVLPDQTSFIALDLISAKLWNIEYPTRPFTLFDKYEDEVTAAGLNHASPNIFAIGDATGSVKLFDMASHSMTASFDTAAHCNPCYSDPAVTSVKFEPSGVRFAIRNFSHLQVWDSRNTTKPLAVKEVQWHPERADYSRYGDTRHDAFGSLFTSSGNIYSGMFGKYFISWDWQNSVLVKHRTSRRSVPDQTVDFTKKVSRVVSNHSGNVLGVASTAALFFYQLD